MRDYTVYIYLAYALVLFVLTGIVGNYITGLDFKSSAVNSVELRLGKQLIEYTKEFNHE